MIDIGTVTRIHNILIEEFGGGTGLRDQGALEAALNRPFATFDGVDLYTSAIEKAAALFESIIINYPFVDGNKRTAYVLMKFLLSNNGIILTASENEKYKMVIDASSGAIRFEEIKDWLQSHTTTQQ